MPVTPVGFGRYCNPEHHQHHQESDMTLYVLKAIPSGLYKIEISDQFDRRLSAIRRQNSESVEVVRTYHADEEYIRQLEKELHEELRAVRWQCEWFYGGVEVNLVIARLDRDFNFHGILEEVSKVRRGHVPEGNM